jgi:hypothetical protein
LLWLDEVSVIVKSSLDYKNYFQHAEIDKKNADDFRSSVTTLITILTIVKYLLLALGIVFIVAAIGVILFSYVEVCFPFHFIDYYCCFFSLHRTIHPIDESYLMDKHLPFLFFIL